MIATWLKVSAAAAVIAAFGLTIEVVRVRAVRTGDREAMRIGMEDVASRVRTTEANLARTVELNNRSAIAKAHALALLIAQDPTLVEDHERFIALRKPLDVEEIHVSDEKGILIQCYPETSLGLDMNSAEQPRPFMAALTNKTFELVQEPQTNRVVFKVFQYAGVARVDKPGIVQIGYSANRVAEARRLADVNAIATSTRIGRGGVVAMSKNAGLEPPPRGIRVETADDCRDYVYESDVGSHRVAVRLPVYGSRLSDDGPFTALCILDALIVLAMLLSRFASVKVVLERNFRALAVLFGALPGAQTGDRHSWARRWLFNPMTLACALAFACAVVVCWVIFARSARATAEEALLKAAGDMRGQIDSCVDQQLFYVGSSICKEFGSPTAISQEKAAELCRVYGLDEVNVVGPDGIVVSAGEPTMVGFRMDSFAESGKFNRLLEGEATYSQPFRESVENSTRRRKFAGVAFPPPEKGYLQLGFAEARLKDELDYWFGEVAEDWHIGKTGFFVIAKDETGAIDSCGLVRDDGTQAFARGDTLAGVGFDVSVAPVSPQQFFTATIYGTPCLCLNEVRSFHRCIAAMPLAEIEGGTLRTVSMAILVLFGVFVLVGMFMTRLSGLVASLKGYIADAASREEKEMAMAMAIQTNVLPMTFPPYPDLADKLDLHARMITAKKVGGDFYDFYFVSPGRLALVIADVSGKGVPAALFMMRAKTTLQELLKGGRTIAEAVAAANDRLAESNDANMFVTAWIGIVDIETGAVEYVNAGHNPPLVKRVGGSVGYLTEKSGPPLAAMPGVVYQRKEMSLARGDGIVLYTDGVTEAVNRELELFGEDRLKATLTGLLGARDASDILKGIVGAVSDFVGGCEQADDITLLAFKLRG